MENIKTCSIYVLIQSYNRKQLIKKAIKSFIDVYGNDRRFHVLVYDAGSTDGSIEYLQRVKEKQECVELSIYTNPTGLSFSAGHNRLLEEVPSNQTQNSFILFYESDNAIRGPEGVEQALEAIERTSASAVGFTPERYDGKRTTYGGKFPNKGDFLLGQRISGAFKKSEHGKRISSDLFEVDWCVTSPLLVRVTSIFEIGGFDYKNFPFGHSDIDLCERLRNAGGKVLLLRTSSFVHDNIDYPSEWSAGRVLDFHRATFRLLEKHRGKMSLLARAGLCGRHILEVIVLATMTPFSYRARCKVDTRIYLLKACWVGYEK